MALIWSLTSASSSILVWRSSKIRGSSIPVALELAMVPCCHSCMLQVKYLPVKRSHEALTIIRRWAGIQIVRAHPQGSSTHIWRYIQNIQKSRFHNFMCFAHVENSSSSQFWQARECNEKDGRVTWRQCNTKDTVGSVTGKPGGLFPRDKNKYNQCAFL